MVFVALLALAGCQSKPQGLTPEQIALLQSQGFKLTDNGWEFGLSDKVLFGNNIGKLNPESTETVQKMGRALLSVGITKFRLDGHTDNYGEDSYNDQLSCAAPMRWPICWPASAFHAPISKPAAWASAIPLPTTAPPAAARKTAASRSSSRHKPPICAFIGA